MLKVQGEGKTEQRKEVGIGENDAKIFGNVIINCHAVKRGSK